VGEAANFLISREKDQYEGVSASYLVAIFSRQKLSSTKLQNKNEKK
jgi:hypothetical protein